jgi:hypothetical protein
VWRWGGGGGGVKGCGKGGEVEDGRVGVEGGDVCAGEMGVVLPW